MEYQAGVGALFAACLLAEIPLDDLLGLAGSRVKSIRFETNAPVDDLLVETDRGGFIAIQAKASITLSSSLSSPLGSVADQFVLATYTVRACMRFGSFDQQTEIHGGTDIARSQRQMKVRDMDSCR